jgi:hypothetical protein
MALDNMDYEFDEDNGVFNQPLEMEEQPRRRPSRGDSPLNGLFHNLSGNPMILGIGALVIGLVIGLILAWGIWPVKYVNATPENLHPNFQLDYMQMVIDSFTLRQDNSMARQRIDALGEAGPTVLQLLIQNPGDELSRAAIDLFLRQYDPMAAGAPSADPNAGGGLDPATGGEAEPEAPGGLLGRSSTLLLAACGVTGLVAVAGAAYYFLRIRNQPQGVRTAAARANEYSQQAEQTDYEAIGEAPPIAQWMTTYLIGDDLFDDSFSIDAPTGEFLGECGVGIADTIGVGEPKRVSAFEVWLFDKNDIQTVTKVLMSAHAINDANTYARLEAKGEPVQARLGDGVVLDTKTLRMAVRVMDMDYGTGHLPENSFFQRITLELAIWALDDEMPY